MKTIALCLNIQELKSSFRDTRICKKYPGAGFLPHLARLADEAGYQIFSGTHCSIDILRKDLDPKEVFILQEDFNPEGLELINFGAHPQVVFCMESKMYAPDFYDRLDDFKRVFKYQLLFEGGTHPLHFPTYDQEDLDRPRPTWEERKPLCMISSNKQWWSMQPRWNSPSWCSAIRNELHTARLRAIEQNPEMDLYGHGWGNLDNIPPHWAFLKPQIQKRWKGPVTDKLETLSQYQSAICYENTSEPGYLTEKMVDCSVVATLPIYLGPTDDTAFPYRSNPKQFKKHGNAVFAQQIMDLMK